jgi:hypothetical protein
MIVYANLTGVPLWWIEGTTPTRRELFEQRNTTWYDEVTRAAGGDHAEHYQTGDVVSLMRATPCQDFITNGARALHNACAA